MILLFPILPQAQVMTQQFQSTRGEISDYLEKEKEIVELWKKKIMTTDIFCSSTLNQILKFQIL